MNFKDFKDDEIYRDTQIRPKMYALVQDNHIVKMMFRQFPRMLDEMVKEQCRLNNKKNIKKLDKQ